MFDDVGARGAILFDLGSHMWCESEGDITGRVSGVCVEARPLSYSYIVRPLQSYGLREGTCTFLDIHGCLAEFPVGSCDELALPLEDSCEDEGRDWEPQRLDRFVVPRNNQNGR